MHQQKWFLSGFQVTELISASYLPLTFWIFPRIAIEQADRDAQWSVLVAILTSVFMAWIHTLINQRFPTLTACEYTNLVYGKWLGKFFSFCYLPVYLVFTSICVYLFITAIKPYFPSTPRVVLEIVIFLVATRGAWIGVETLGRISSIVHPLTLAAVTFIFIFIMTQSNHFWLPHEIVSLPLTLKGALHILPIYLGFSFFLLIGPYYNHNKRIAKWYPLISVFISGFVILVAFFAVILNLGWEGTRTLSFSIPFVLQLIRIQGFFVERLGILIIVVSTAFSILFLAIHIWGISSLACQIFTNSEKHYKYWVIPVSASGVIIASLIPNEQMIFDIINMIMVPASVVLLLIIPFTTLLIAMIRRLKTEPPPSFNFEGDRPQR
ncbi:GerAB/ArcD/ProY family transporter [Alicyclobacillus tolerans]|uniref:Spore germination protein (Amino acid permease) n=1 Tax=Alicyclobacillus tolerans TaxID=90970 RepID=A0ABT9LZI4_9BACL|nr:GerAB/ArcD/ProY family transporter [Alicyclobacillus tengchongensis]MDP9729646.1 spore germination protein (amino acid permease) [Alicyclobacillus tengchongensis]